MNKAKITIVHALDTDVEIVKEPSIYAQNGLVYFLPEGVLLEDTVPRQDYNRLKEIMRENSSSFLKRLRFLFKGYVRD